MTRLFALLLLPLMLANCTNHPVIADSSVKVDTENNAAGKPIGGSNKVDTAFRLDFFKAIPDTIDGCGEYFTYDTSKATNDRYIFLSNLTDFAIIRIGGKNIYLVNDTIESKEINDKSYVAVYKGEEYKAILKVKQTKAYDEGGFYAGTLQIIGRKVNVTFKVHGDAGC
jgi:hypothetical protein